MYKIVILPIVIFFSLCVERKINILLGEKRKSSLREGESQGGANSGIGMR